MRTFSATDTGRLRENNQDSVFCRESAVGFFPNLFLVADGMGGHNAGDVASKTCVEAFSDAIGSSVKRTPVGIFEEAVQKTNSAIYEKSERDISLRGMGTTLVALTVMDDVAYVVNVGDSRFYLFRDRLMQISVDHSLVEEMVMSGKLAKDEMRTHPNKNIITRALGTRERVRPDCFEIEVQKSDVLLLCSDGLSNMVDDKDIERIIRVHADDVDKMGTTLIDEANLAGGKDNISVVLVQI